MLIFQWFCNGFGRLESKNVELFIGFMRFLVVWKANMLIFRWFYLENASAGAAQVQAASNARDPPVDTVEPFFLPLLEPYIAPLLGNHTQFFARNFIVPTLDPKFTAYGGV